METLTTLNRYWQHGRIHSVTEMWGRDEIKNVDLGCREGGETKNLDLLDEVQIWSCIHKKA